MKINVPSLVSAAGGELVGKIRLQKVVYLLDQMGLSSPFSFEYHHYGPYSADLADSIEDDVAFGYLAAEQRRRQSDGVPYVAYRAIGADEGNSWDAYLPDDEIRSALGQMQHRSATVLELAATIHWLAVIERNENWSAELIRRKGAKAQGGRDQQALELLRSLRLPPAVNVPSRA